MCDQTWKFDNPRFIYLNDSIYLVGARYNGIVLKFDSITSKFYEINKYPDFFAPDDHCLASINDKIQNIKIINNIV